LYLDTDGINKLVKEYEADTKALKEEIFRFSWFMRGGLSFTEAYLLTPEDRELIGKIIESNLEVAKAQGIPFF
jgi:hypothetical protein